MSYRNAMPILSNLGCAIALVAALSFLAIPSTARAQDNEERPLGWKNSTELGWVLTTGNSNTSNFNVRNLFAYDWEEADLDWEFGYLRASSDDDRFAVGLPGDFEIIRPDRDPDNDRLFTNIRYLRNINERFFWYARFEAVRDQPADIEHRYTPSLGAGNTWADREDLTFLTGYGISYTDEELTLDGPSSFAGYQLFYNLRVQATSTTSVESSLVFDGSFEDAGNYRFDWYNSAGVNVSDNIALKAAIRLVYRNEPALEEIDLVARPAGLGLVIDTVTVPKDKLDTAFTTSLVINF